MDNFIASLRAQDKRLLASIEDVKKSSFSDEKKKRLIANLQIILDANVKFYAECASK